MPARFLDRHVGGNTTYARRIAEGLTSRGIHVGKITAGRHPLTTALRETAAGLQSGRGRRDELIHYVGDTGPLMGVRRPSVVTVHGVASRWIDVARTRTQEAAWRFRVGRAVSAADHVITVSDSSANDVAEIFGVDRSRLTTIKHGIDVGKFTARAQLSDAIASAVPAEFVLYLGNIEPRKNLLPLIEAFATPEVRSLNLPLVIAGKPAWNSVETMDAIARSGNVIHLGFVSDEDRTALMQHCAMFAFPSLYEGFGFPVLEALAAGAVVITSQRGSLAEVAGPSLTFPDLDRDGIAAGLVQAVEDNDARETCAAEGLDWAKSFDWEESVDKHVTVYEGVLS